MFKVISVGKRLIPIEEIAFAESYEPKENSSLQSSRNFQTRLVLIDRDSVLIETPVALFAETNGFRPLENDPVALNPALRFKVETFEPSAEFSPAKPFSSRLRWRAPDGNDHSKLLVTLPEVVLSVLTGKTVERAAPEPRGQDKPSRRARGNKQTLTQS